MSIESPVRATADLTKTVNSWGTAAPDFARGIVGRLGELTDFGLDFLYAKRGVRSRRFLNQFEIIDTAIPQMREDAQVPDDDWLDEFLDLAGKRSRADLQQMLAKVLAQESNTPGNVPQRYIHFMADIDKDVIDEFIDFCQWMAIPSLKTIVARDNIQLPSGLIEARLVTHSPAGFEITLDSDMHNFLQWEDMDHRFNFPAGARIPVGNFALTSFGEMIYDLLDPKPAISPEVNQLLLSLWKRYEEDPE